MSELTFLMTNAVGLWIPNPGNMYVRAQASDLANPTYSGSTTLQFKFTNPSGTVLDTYPVQSSAVTSAAIPLPCTMTVTVQDLPVGSRSGVIIAQQNFAFGLPGASVGNVYYPSPLFQAITTSIVANAVGSMAVTCTGSGYFSLPALTSVSVPPGFLVQFAMSGFQPDKQFTVTIAGGSTSGMTPGSGYTPFVGSVFVLTAGANRYQLFYPNTGTTADGALTLAADTGPVFTFSSGAFYKASIGMMTEQFASNPIVDDTGVLCGTMSFAADSTAVDNKVLVFQLKGISSS